MAAGNRDPENTPRGKGSSLGPIVAGTWYPADEVALRAEVDAFLAEADDAEGLAGLPQPQPRPGPIPGKGVVGE